MLSSLLFAGLASTVLSAPTTSNAALQPRTNTDGRVAAWWGQVPDTVDLQEICDQPDIDIVMLSFLNHYWADDGVWPSLNFGAYTAGPSKAQQAAGAMNLTDGSNLVPAIQSCQKGGKKVYLSMGGDARFASATFKNDDEATAFAQNVFSLFLGGTGNSTTDPLRPFGTDVVLDGIDMDSENLTPDHYDTFVNALRSLMKADSSHTYGISAVPQCTRDWNDKTKQDGNFPDAVLKLVDDVFMQFYNQQGCMHTDGDDFYTSIKNWAGAIGDAKLWIGTPITAASAPLGGYIPLSDIPNEVNKVVALDLPNFGGYALWDASLAINSKNAQGKTFDSVVKTSLGEIPLRGDPAMGPGSDIMNDERK